MPWFKVDDKLGEHPKVRAIPRSRRRNAMGLWILAGPWCSLNLRDGNVPSYMLEEFCSKECDAEALVRVGLWHTSGHECPECPQPRDDGGYIFHDWPSLQYTREQVLAKRDADAERQRLWRERKRGEKEAQSQDRHDVTGAESQARNATVQPSRPVPSRPVLTTERGDRTETLHAAAETAPLHNSDTCTRHPNGNPTDEPCRGCQRVEERTSRRAAREADRARVAAERAAIDCDRCDGTWIVDADKNPTRRKCDHRRSA